MLTIAAAPAFAQAGSTGGSIGKSGKSASGQSENPPATAAPSRKPARSGSQPSERTASRDACATLSSHAWSSWASGLFGAGDTTFQAGGAAIHSSGIRGQWTCKTGKMKLRWGDDKFGGMHFSDDGKNIIGDEDKKTWFTRRD